MWSDAHCGRRGPQNGHSDVNSRPRGEFLGALNSNRSDLSIDNHIGGNHFLVDLVELVDFADLLDFVYLVYVGVCWRVLVCVGVCWCAPPPAWPWARPNGRGPFLTPKNLKQHTKFRFLKTAIRALSRARMQ